MPLGRCVARDRRPVQTNPRVLCLDKGYDFDEVSDARWTSLASPLTRRNAAGGEEDQLAQHLKREASGSKPGVARWWNDCAQLGLNRFRRILVRWDKSPDN